MFEIVSALMFLIFASLSIATIIRFSKSEYQMLS